MRYIIAFLFLLIVAHTTAVEYKPLVLGADGKTRQFPDGEQLRTVPTYGLDAAKPAAATANNGMIYCATDTQKIYRSNGSSWILFSVGSLGSSDIGSTPNAQGLTITGTSINLEPADASNGGVLTTGAQTFAGDKTLNGSFTQNHTGTNSSGEIAHTLFATNTAALTNNNAASSFATLYTVQPSGASGAPVYYTGIGASVNVPSAANNHLSGATVYGSKSILNWANAATSGTAVDYLIGNEVEIILAQNQTSGSTTLNNVTGFQVSPGPWSTAAGGTTYITTYKGLEILPVAYSGAGTTSITNQWNIYSQDTAGGSYFGSPVFIVGGHAPVVGGFTHQGTGGIRTRQASTQDAVQLLGRAGGTSSFGNQITTAALTANRTTTLPDANLTIVGGGTVTLAGGSTSLSGTNTGDQTITLTGDVTGSGTGSFATSIANNAITSARIAANAVGNTDLSDMATQTFKGRTTAATGDPEDLTVAQAQAMLGLTGTNSGDVTLAAIGSTANSNGATLTGQVLNLQPASASFGGVVTTGAQTFAGNKTFSSIITGPAATTSTATFNVPHGSAPTAPNNGDLWTTTAGFFGRVNGATVGPFGAGGGGGITGTLTSGRVPFANGASSVSDSSKLTFSTATGLSVQLSGATNSLTLGSGAGNTTFTGAENTIVGAGSGSILTTATGNTIVGSLAGTTPTTGGGGVIVGAYSDSTPNSASDFTVCGSNSFARGSSASAFGAGAEANINGVSLGAQSFAGNYSVALGYGADNFSNSYCVALGTQSVISANYGIAVGTGNTVSAADTIVIGHGSIDPGIAGSLQIGSPSHKVTNAYLGEGADSDPGISPGSFALQPSRALGTNVAGAQLILAGGISTGNAAGGSVVIQTVPAGSSGSALNTRTTRLTISSAGDLSINTVGRGLQIKEGSNAKMGTATLVAGTVVVSTAAVTATSRIFLTSQSDGGTVGFQRVSARTAATSFTITSSNAADTSTIAWFIVEPSP